MEDFIDKLDDIKKRGELHKEKRKRFIENAKTILIFLLMTCILVISVYFNFKTDKPSEPSKPSESNDVNDDTDDPKPEEIPKVINFGFENIGELTTSRYYFTIVKNYEDADHLFGIGDKQLIVSYDGYINYGIDMTQATFKVNDAHDTYKVYIPKIQMLGTPTIDEDSFETYLEIGRLSADVHNQIRQEIKEKAISDAEANGAYENAKENARIIVTDMIDSIATTNDVTISIVFEDDLKD